MMIYHSDAMETIQSIHEGPTTVISVLEQFSTSAEGIAKFSHLVISEVEEGRVDPLKIALFMKTMEKIMKQVNDRLTEYYVREAEKHSQKTFSHLGAEICIAEHGTKYDYSSCGHPGWTDLTKIIDEAVKQRKEIEDLLKVLKTATDLIIEGEGITVRPPVKSSKTGINISIK